MEKLTFEISITEDRGNGWWRFGHKILYLTAGSYSGDSLGYYDPGGGTVLGYDLQLAAWKTLSLAIQGTRSLRMLMPKDPEIEKFYQRHTELADAIKNISIVAYSTTNPRRLDSPPDQSIGLFDVTVSSGMFTKFGLTSVGLLYSGATKEWF